MKRDANLEETFRLFREGDPKDLTVWIGRDGCAVHPGGRTSACLPVSPSMAHRFIHRHRLTEKVSHPDGIAYHA